MIETMKIQYLCECSTWRGYKPEHSQENYNSIMIVANLLPPEMTPNSCTYVWSGLGMTLMSGRWDVKNRKGSASGLILSIVIITTNVFYICVVIV